MRVPVGRRGFLKATGLAGAVAAVNARVNPAVAATPAIVGGGPLAVPVLNPRASISQPALRGDGATQLHTHTNVPLDHQLWEVAYDVLRWYARHGFQAAALTDLQHQTPVDGAASLLNNPGRFLVIPGVEPSREPLSPGELIVDTVGVFLEGQVDLDAPGVNGPDPQGQPVVDILTAQAKAILKVGGVPIIAHPRMTLAVSGRDIANTNRGHRPLHVEVFTGEAGSGWKGGGGLPGAEAVVDEALTLGRQVHIVAADDVHHLQPDDQGKSTTPNRHLANRGEGWVVIHADTLSIGALRDAMNAGRYYATAGKTGISFLTWEWDRSGIKLTLDQATDDLGWGTPPRNRRLYTTTFIGAGGKALGDPDVGYSPEWTFRGHPGADTNYVRALVVDQNNNMAWTQAVGTFRR